MRASLPSAAPPVQPRSRYLSRDQQILTRFGETGNMSQVAREFGITREWVRQILKRRFAVEHPLRQRAEAQIAEVATLIAEGATRSDIKAKMVLGHAARTYIQRRSVAVKLIRNEDAHLRQLYAREIKIVEAGGSIRTAAKRDHAFEGRLSRILRRLGVGYQRARWSDFSYRINLHREHLGLGLTMMQSARLIVRYEREQLGHPRRAPGSIIQWLRVHYKG